MPFPTSRSQTGKAQDALDAVLTEAHGLRVTPKAAPVIYLAAISFMAQHLFIQSLPGSYDIATAVRMDQSPRGQRHHDPQPNKMDARKRKHLFQGSQ